MIYTKASMGWLIGLLAVGVVGLSIGLISIKSQIDHLSERMTEQHAVIIDRLDDFEDRIEELEELAHPKEGTQ